MNQQTRRTIFIIGALVTFFVPFQSQGAIIAPELQSALQSLSAQDELPVILNLSEKADLSALEESDRALRRQKVVHALKAKAEMTQEPLKAFLERKGGRRIIPLWIKNAIAVAVSRALIGELVRWAAVESIELDSVVYGPVVTPGSSGKPEWNLSAIHAPDLWVLGYSGTGVVVSTMDTGVDIHHPDLQGKWRGGANSWFNPFSNPVNASSCAVPDQCSPCELSSDVPCDTDGHGTGTMGVIVGGSEGGTAIGVAPGSKWISVKIFNDAYPYPTSKVSIIHQGFQWVLNPDGDLTTQDAPDVLNASWGVQSADGCDATFLADIEALKAAGIAVVFAAGNYGPAAPSSISPANYAQAFAAGAVDSSLVIAPFSSRGPSACDGRIFPEVVAPGVNIRTSDVTNGGIFPDSYFTVSGTSFSAPHASGAMALLLSAFPEATVSELERVLRQSARDLGPVAGPDNDYGYGLVDVLAAYELLASATAISVNPLSYNFGKIKEGSLSIPKTFTVSNGGTDGISLGPVSLTGPNGADFDIESDTCSGYSVPPSEICTVQLLFSPTSGGPKNAYLSIPVNDSTINPFSVALVGNGIEQFRLTAGKTGTGKGQIRSKSPGIDCATSCSVLFSPGAEVSLTALPDAESVIGGWSGCTRRSGTTCTITMNADKNVSATFIGPGLTLVSPNGGEVLKAGTHQRIEWTFTGRPGPSVKIDLLQGGIFVHTIAKKASKGSSGKGSFSWRIPRALPGGTDYTIRITGTKDSAVTDVTDSAFGIAP